MILYLGIVAIVNLGLGLALASHLGRRHQAMLDAENWSDLDRLERLADDDLETREPEMRDAPSGSCGSAGSNASVIEEFRTLVGRFETELAEVHEQLRRADPAGETELLNSRADALLEAMGTYLENRGPVCRRLLGLLGQERTRAGARKDLRGAVQHENGEIEGMRQAVAELAATEFKNEHTRLTDRAGRLIAASHRLRDALDKAMAILCREAAEQFPAIAARTDPLTGVTTRAGLEATLDAWCANHDEHAPHRGVAMLDLDHFARLNEQFGYRAGNEVLRAVGQLLRDQGRGDVQAIRFTGQRFVLLLPGADLRATTEVIERTRRTIEAARYSPEGREIRATASGSATEILADDTANSLLTRAAAALSEAKRYGRNRTFVDEGDGPSPAALDTR